MRLHLISFGKLKTPGLREAADYYLKLLKPWVSVEDLELKPVAVTDKSPATRLKIQDAEAKLLREKLDARFDAKLRGRSAYYLLDEDGRSLSTTTWAESVTQWENQSVSSVAFCIGSSMGFSDSIKKSARAVLSLGPQTLSHELARVVLIEQLYRAWSVTRGHPYHNAD